MRYFIAGVGSRRCDACTSNPLNSDASQTLPLISIHMLFSLDLAWSDWLYPQLGPGGDYHGMMTVSDHRRQNRREQTNLLLTIYLLKCSFDECC